MKSENEMNFIKKSETIIKNLYAQNAGKDNFRLNFFNNNHPSVKESSKVINIKRHISLQQNDLMLSLTKSKFTEDEGTDNSMITQAKTIQKSIIPDELKLNLYNKRLINDSGYTMKNTDNNIDFNNVTTKTSKSTVKSNHILSIFVKDKQDIVNTRNDLNKNNLKDLSIKKIIKNEKKINFHSENKENIKFNAGDDLKSSEGG